MTEPNAERSARPTLSILFDRSDDLLRQVSALNDALSALRAMAEQQAALGTIPAPVAEALRLAGLGIEFAYDNAKTHEELVSHCLRVAAGPGEMGQTTDVLSPEVADGLSGIYETVASAIAEVEPLVGEVRALVLR